MSFRRVTAAGAILSFTAFVACVTLSPPARAAVTPDEAARLRSELTPLGAERAGNKEGTIPAWDGGYIKVPPGYQSGQPRPDPFAGESPVLQITGKNAVQYADKLSDGVMALLQRYPTYRLNVYPTHRTAAAPQWMYDNTFKNATRARTIHNGISVENAFGGVPFPIPRNGHEAMWNYHLVWRGESAGYNLSVYLVINGKPVLTSAGATDFQFPYYYRDGSAETFRGIYSMTKLITTGPPLKAGENVLLIEPVDHVGVGRKAWQYLAGQRRVRRAPNIAYDTPHFANSGFSLSDEAVLFNGAMDRYDWKLLGKKEMFIPYNTYAFQTTKPDQLLGPDHLNPDRLRWELHRVWVVEATLAEGKRHALHRRRIYLDEDSWLAVLADGWDAQGQLWHSASAFPIAVPELPAVVSPSYVIYDLLKRGYVASSLLSEGKRHYQILPRRPETEFSPSVLAAEGIR